MVPLLSNFDVEDKAEYHQKYRAGDAKRGGGLVVEGTIGAMFKNPHIVKFESPNSFRREDHNRNYYGGHDDNGTSKRRRGNFRSNS